MNNLSVNQLSGSRGECLLFSDLSFELKPGDLLQIVGDNGSGKTTCLRLLAGLMPITSGQILWKDKSIASDRASYYRDLGYLGHSLGIKLELTVLENLYLSWKKPLVDQEEMNGLVQQFELQNYQNTECRFLSRGQLQRVALLRLISSKSILWILDEPFAALDQSAIALLQDIFVKQLQTGLIIFSSHQALTLSELSPRSIRLS